MLFNVWADGQHSKTTIIADSLPEALDLFCAHHGFIDHADYCQAKGLEESNLNLEETSMNVLCPIIYQVRWGA